MSTDAKTEKKNTVACGAGDEEATLQGQCPTCWGLGHGWAFCTAVCINCKSVHKSQRCPLFAFGYDGPYSLSEKQFHANRARIMANLSAAHAEAEEVLAEEKSKADMLSSLLAVSDAGMLALPDKSQKGDDVAMEDLEGKAKQKEETRAEGRVLATFPEGVDSWKKAMAVVCPHWEQLTKPLKKVIKLEMMETLLKRRDWQTTDGEDWLRKALASHGIMELPEVAEGVQQPETAEAGGEGKDVMEVETHP